MANVTSNSIVAWFETHVGTHISGHIAETFLWISAHHMKLSLKMTELLFLFPREGISCPGLYH